MKAKKVVKKNKLAIKWAAIFLAAVIIIGCLAFFAPQAIQAAGPPYYFKFNIPAGIKYSPGWHGYSNSCLDDAVVDLYNDKEGYGIAHTNKFIPKNFFDYTSKSDADKVITSVKDEVGVYFGQKLADRWLPEIQITDKDVTIKDGIATLVDKSKMTEPVEIVSKKAVYCPICGAFIQWSYEGITDSRMILYCPNGHKVVTKSYD